MWHSSKASACRRGPSSHETANSPLAAASCAPSREPQAEQVTAAGIVGLRLGAWRSVLRSNAGCLANSVARLSAQRCRISAHACQQAFSAPPTSVAHRNLVALVPASVASFGQLSLVLHRRRCRPAGLAHRTARPNPSLNRTRYGKRRKPELRHMVHHLSPGLRHLPPRAG